MSLIDFAGTDDLQEALKMWEAEREAMRDLRDENIALRIYNRRLRLVIDLSLRLFTEIEKGGMFVPAKAFELIEKARGVIEDADTAIQGSKELFE